MYVVSACLIGKNCRYNGGNSRDDRVLELLKDKEYIDVCPEELGGLTTPRQPNEIVDGRVVDKSGNDVTEFFLKGALETYEAAIRKSMEVNQPIEMAILKARSPSCGSGKIYDGTFTGKQIDGNGITSELLIKNGIKVITEEDL
ncbi:MAG: DUF523 domain-containing protein [Eubacteriales bacterium]